MDPYCMLHWHFFYHCQYDYILTHLLFLSSISTSHSIHFIIGIYPQERNHKIELIMTGGRGQNGRQL